MQITLMVTEGPHAGRSFSFRGHDTFMVGRDKRTHFRLPEKDRYFSRFHFLVEVNPPYCRLMDLGSRNGTYVNGQKVSSADLKHGDEIKAGHTLLRIVFSETEDTASNSPPTVKPAPPPAPKPPPADDIPVAPKPMPKPPSTGEIHVPLKPASTSELHIAPKPPSAGEVHIAPKPAPAPPRPAPCPLCSAPVTEPGICSACRELAAAQEQLIPGYLIVRELGRGGMGVVSLALCEASGKAVALKTMKPATSGSRTQVERFLREAKIVKELDHPHIVAYRDMGETEGLLWFAMDYVKGTDAARLLAREGPLAVGRAVGMICQLLDGLAYAHEKGFVHRDIKPANLLIGHEGDREKVHLADFGLARAYQSSHLSGLTMSGSMGGTLAFIPPEQLTDFRNTRPAADQYATAATLYNLLTGKFVYDLPPGDIQKQLMLILVEDTVPIRTRRPDLSRDLETVIKKALARDPERRYPDVGAFGQALARFITA